MKHSKTFFFVFVLLYALLPLRIALASIIINEIMYDLPGTDTGREWIELFNNGNEAVDISKWVLREAEINHKLEISQGEPSIPPNGYAILADNPAKFLIDNPQFTGALFDSSFSLSNTGETLLLKNGDSDVDTVSYANDMGGSEGATLNREGNTFKNGTATPGASNSNSASPSNTLVATEATTSMQEVAIAAPATASSGGGSYYKVEQQIFPDAGPNRTVLVGSEVLFTGTAVGINKEPLQNARFFWNFGDGETKEGKQVLHTYHFLGEYIVTLDVTSGEYAQGDRAVIKVVEPTLSISLFVKGVSGYTEVKNKGGIELDLSGFQIKQQGKTFVFPKGTLVAQNGVLKIANSVSGFFDESRPVLFYPSGAVVPSSGIQPASSQPMATSFSPGTISKKTTQTNGNLALAASAFTASEIKLTEEQAGNTQEKKSDVWIWGLGLIAFCGLISGSIIYVRRTKTEADSYTIIDDEE